MLAHSYLYYHLDTSIISDDVWQKWADELVELQKECKTIGFYDDEFEDWDGSTGCHLITDDWVYTTSVENGTGGHDMSSVFVPYCYEV